MERPRQVLVGVVCLILVIVLGSYLSERIGKVRLNDRIEPKATEPADTEGDFPKLEGLASSEEIAVDDRVPDAQPTNPPAPVNLLSGLIVYGADDAPAVGCAVAAFDSLRADRSEITTLCDSDGRFSMRLDRGGLYTLTAVHRVGDDVWRAQRTLNSHAGNLEISLAPCTLGMKIRVADEDDQSIAGATVSWAPGGHTGESRNAVRAAANGDGTVWLRNLPPAYVRIHVDAPDYKSAFRLVNPLVQRDITVRLYAARSLRIRVVEEGGQAIGGARLRIRHTMSREWSDAVADAHGIAEIQIEDRIGSTYVSASAPGFGSKRAEEREGKDELTIELRRERSMEILVSSDTGRKRVAWEVLGNPGSQSVILGESVISPGGHMRVHGLDKGSTLVLRFEDDSGLVAFRIFAVAECPGSLTLGELSADSGRAVPLTFRPDSAPDEPRGAVEVAFRPHRPARFANSRLLSRTMLIQDLPIKVWRPADWIYSVRTRSPIRARKVTRIVGPNETLCTVKCDAMRRLRGSVVGSSGPVAHANIVFTSEAGDVLMRARTDQYGKFATWVVRSSTKTLYVWAFRGKMTQASRMKVPRSAEELRLTLE